MRKVVPVGVTLVQEIDTVSNKIKGSTVQLKTTFFPTVVVISDGTTITSNSVRKDSSIFYSFKDVIFLV